MKLNHVFSRVLCLVLCLVSLILPALSVSAAEAEQPESRNAAAVRYSRKSGSLVIGYVEEGTELKVLDDSYNTVYKIDCFDMSGYIAKENVREENGHYFVTCFPEDVQTRSFDLIPAQQTEQVRQALYETAKKYLGVRYRYGGSTPKGFDCSGFTRYIFGTVGIELQRSSQQQVSDGIVIAKHELRCGDLLFYTGTHRGAMITHVAMYIGDGMMIHATSKGIVIDPIDTDYYARRYLCARRVILSDYDSTEAYQFPVDGGMPAARMTADTAENNGYVRNMVDISDKCDIIKLIMFSKDGMLE